jgi:hypothetical protein
MAHSHEALVCQDVDESRGENGPASKQLRVNLLVGLACAVGAACLLTAKHAVGEPMQHMTVSGVTGLDEADPKWKAAWLKECTIGMTNAENKLKAGRMYSRKEWHEIKDHDNFCADSYTKFAEGTWTPWRSAPPPNSADTYYSMMYACVYRKATPEFLSPSAGGPTTDCSKFVADGAKYK